jgi:hypothetical protein
MSRLTHAQRRYVVQRLARFQTPTEVVKAVKEEFGLEVSRQAVHQYDPAHNARLAEEWRTLHAEERARFLNSLDEIGPTHRTFRVSELAGFYRRAKARGNDRGAAEFLKQIAQEMGDVFKRYDVSSDIWMREVADALGLTADDVRLMMLGRTLQLPVSEVRAAMQALAGEEAA